MRLKDKVCIITGAASGIGRATTFLFLQEGAKVAAFDVNRDALNKLSEDAGNLRENLATYVVDVSKFEEVKEAVDDVFEKFGRIDALINNAGITRDALIEKLEEKDWDAVINVNLKGVFNMTKVVYPYMLEIGKGSIVNTSSVVGIYGNIGQTNYAATKAGVIGMTKTWAKEFSRKGAAIRVNAVAPGFIETRMTEKIPDKLKDLFKQKIALKRFGKPEEVAKVYLFLASDESSYITGQVIGVDGGTVL
ncbi:MAG: 3-oxoacyl-[acyl-carrier-protein] reductase [Thermotogaceae bacterium]|nr:3-oxoacyl-[acyl-carrier-protein] reductase [Thermotogaceae bacterium]